MISQQQSPPSRKNQLENTVATCLNILLVIDFHSQWCEPCRKMGPVFSRMEKQYPKVKFVQVDVDAYSGISDAFGIEFMPTFVFIRNRKKIAQFSGANEKHLRTEIERLK
ncbi:Thioredoxin [Fasciolopsis buskii]|uniref:Thioredoxin n=1 Tax=Fasciolopsis buskii TaxID=27845 RepID=A0A8E0VHW8_9TREM|nr:Thioredoxin [Fasciolopsis buski]